MKAIDVDNFELDPHWYCEFSVRDFDTIKEMLQELPDMVCCQACAHRPIGGSKAPYAWCYMFDKDEYCTKGEKDEK